MTYIIFALSTVLLGMCYIGLAKILYPAFGLMDKPELYGHDREPVPYSMGLIFFCAFATLMLVFLGFNKEIVTVLLATFTLVVMAFFDDKINLSPFLRLFVQIACAVIVVWSGVEVLEIANPFGPVNFQLAGWGAVLSVIWIVALTNLVNFLDGVSGLSSGVSSISFFVLFGLSIWPGMHVVDQTYVSFISLSLGILALLAAVFEFPKPKFLIGDSGSMFFGFMLGVASLISGGKLATVMLVLLIPILDGAWVILRRLYNKQKPWKGDLWHFHHRLIKLGFSEKKLLGSYYVFTFIFGCIALFAWTTFFKVISLLVLFSGFVLTGYYVWIQGKK